MEDPYVYKGTTILENLKDIRNQDELDEFENVMTSLAIMRLHKENTKVHCLNDIFGIHQALFSRVYKWAGQPRTINIYKSEPVLNGLSVEYCDYSTITSEIKKLDSAFTELKWEELDKDTLVKMIAFYFSKLWQIHPFREGNTRSVVTLMSLFIRSLGLNLDSNLMKQHANYFRNALVLNSIREYSEPEHLEKFLTDALLSKTTDVPSEKYKTIKGYELDKYHYSQHSYKD